MILRSFEPMDMKLLKEWDPQHDMWLKDYVPLMDGSARIFIGEIGYPFHPVAWGQIKWDQYEYVLSWFVAPAYRKRGLGKALAKSMADMVDRPIKAKINVNRPVSERVAIGIGMVPWKLLPTNEKWWRRK